MSGNTVETGFEFKWDLVDLSDNSTTVTTRRAMLRAVYVNTAPSAAVVIKDGSDTAFTIPSGVAAGQTIAFGDVVLSGGIVIDPDDAATGSITVIYKPAV